MTSPTLESPYCIAESPLRAWLLRQNERWFGKLQGMLIAARKPELQEVRVVAPTLRSEIRIAHVSDLHAASWLSEAYVDRCVALCQSANVHLVVWTGDFLLHSLDELRRLMVRFAPLQGLQPTFGVLGNHDTYGDTDAIAGIVEDSGVTLLRNDSTHVELKGGRLGLYGIDDLYNGGDLEQALSRREEVDYSLLLSHRSDVLWHLQHQLVDLVLAGHLHGGQVRLPGFRALYLPAHDGQRMIDNLLPTHGRTAVHVTRGIGYAFLPIRIGASPAISLIRLQPR